EAEAAALPLRRPPKVRGAIRIVEVGAYDWSACGGTHVRSAAQIGLIKIIRAEKRGSETRITFRCGKRALADYAQVHCVVARLVDSLNAPRYQVDQAVQRLLDERDRTYKALQDAQTRLARCEAAAMLEGALEGNKGRLLVRLLEDRTPDDLRRLARALCEQDEVITVLGIAGENSCLVFARSAQVEIDMAAQLRQMLLELFPNGGVKGGGSPTFAQSGGFSVTPEQMGRALEATAHRLFTLLR
ncbi:MAG: DHHA1 domain-containing protein, partial [Thermoflexales bacterium]|nr:DHHA1 domain-containing protein [Thermoflexales bacterium]